MRCCLNENFCLDEAKVRENVVVLLGGMYPKTQKMRKIDRFLEEIRGKRVRNGELLKMRKQTHIFGENSLIFLAAASKQGFLFSCLEEENHFLRPWYY